MPDAVLTSAEYLQELARRVTTAYVAAAGTRAALLAGSAASGDADYYSDVDLILYYDELPSEEALAAARASLGVRELDRTAREEHAVLEFFRVDGVECQLAHLLTTRVEARAANLVAEIEADEQMLKVVSGLFEGLPLHGADVIESWRAAIVYSDELQRAQIERHWQFFPLWYFDERIATRDALLWRQEILVEAAFSLLAVLAALNRVWFSRFEVKRMRKLVSRLKLAPPRFADRVEQMLRGDVGELEALVEETRDLVSEHVPGVHLPLREPLHSREQPWHPSNE